MNRDEIDLIPDEELLAAFERRTAHGVVITLAVEAAGDFGEHEVRWRFWGNPHVGLGLCADAQHRIMTALREAMR